MKEPRHRKTNSSSETKNISPAISLEERSLFEEWLLPNKGLHMRHIRKQFLRNTATAAGMMHATEATLRAVVSIHATREDDGHPYDSSSSQSVQ
jgi:hypothetical protein